MRKSHSGRGSHERSGLAVLRVQQAPSRAHGRQMPCPPHPPASTGLVINRPSGRRPVPRRVCRMSRSRSCHGHRHIFPADHGRILRPPLDTQKAPSPAIIREGAFTFPGHLGGRAKTLKARKLARWWLSPTVPGIIPRRPAQTPRPRHAARPHPLELREPRRTPRIRLRRPQPCVRHQHRIKTEDQTPEPAPSCARSAPLPYGPAPPSGPGSAAGHTPRHIASAAWRPS